MNKRQEMGLWKREKQSFSAVLFMIRINILLNTVIKYLWPLIYSWFGEQTYPQLHFARRIFIIKFSMSTKKDKKKGGKDKEKDKERQRMAEEEARKEQERLQAQQRIHVLENSGILDAYEYFLRAICKNGLPEANIFEFAAQQILKYNKKMKGKDTKREQLGNNRSIEKQKEKEVSQEKGKRLQKSSEKLQKSVDKIKPPKGQQPPKQKK